MLVGPASPPLAVVPLDSCGLEAAQAAVEELTSAVDGRVGWLTTNETKMSILAVDASHLVTWCLRYQTFRFRSSKYIFHCHVKA